MRRIKEIEGPTPLTIYHQGPEDGRPRPSLFYFALSGQDSLTLDPFNYPITLLSNLPIHVFSFTLPRHEKSSEYRHAIAFWAKEIERGNDIISSFVKNVCQNIDFLIEKGLVDPHRMATAGLSRGGFIATHLAAQDKRIKTILGYAPMTDLFALEELSFLKENHLAQSLCLKSLIHKLLDKKLYFLIGNRDHKVGTSHCFDFIKDLAEAAYLNQHRSPQIECRITPSIGHKGHGTSNESFKDGIEWLKTKLEI